MGSRGQASIEYMSLLAISLAALFVIWLYVNSSNDAVKQDLRVGFAKQAAEKIADAADLVYIQGAPARVFVEVNVPDGVNSVLPNSESSCSARSVSFFVSTPSGGETEVYSETAASMSGDLSNLAGNPGLKRISVEASSFNGLPCVIVSG